MEPSSRSSVPIIATRSTRGCWTCRLRKKKCDEISPGCRRCESVNITCHYGPKPLWIEDAALGREELKRIKVIVGASASRKRRVLRGKARASAFLSPAYSPGDQPFPGQCGQASHALHQASPNGAQTPSETSPKGVLEGKGPKTLGGGEANLMMHYLDQVFYIQFRFFTPSISTGGRGWLLSLLNKTKPLYHAALSLSAFHQQSLISLNEADQAQIDYLDELERHHNLTLEELQLFIQAHSVNMSYTGALGGNVQILACIVQLISFELFSGGTGKWQIHLGAASRLILTLHGMPQQENPKDILEVTRPGKTRLPEDTALRFFTSAIIWFDILACISTRSRPHLAENHSQLLSSGGNSGVVENEGKVELHRIMGCQNWTMMIIAEMSQLATIQNNNSEHNFDIQQLAITAKNIQRRLEFGHNKIRTELQEVQHKYSGPPPHYLTDIYRQYEVLVVTHIFSSAAFIYLQTIITAHPSVFHIQEPLQDTIAAMKMIPDPRMIRGMIWPLCVAGCMASTPADQGFFRSVAGESIKDSRTFGNSSKALEIMEKSWEIQKREGQLIDCSTSIEKLGACVLLV